MQRRTSLRRAAAWLPYLIALAAGVFFFAHSIASAHTRDSVIDEGAYLYKGYLFVTGEYRPFQEFGPWTNHMPLAFLIPGAVQAFFEPGLRTGRYYAVATSMLMLLGLWLAAHRLGGKWWAAGAVGAMALNTTVISSYSTANSQVLGACLLVWSLVFTLGEGRKPWELTLGTALAGLLLVTRINLAPLLVFLVIYIFWQHGSKRAIWAAGAGLAVVAVVHLVYWPGILQLWAKWLPEAVTPFLDPWRLQNAGVPSWNPDVPTEARIQSFLQGIRVHSLTMLGLAGFGFLWLDKRGWRAEPLRRTSAMLGVLLFILVVSHAWAALGNNYCNFCFSPYISFFTALGLLLIVVTLTGFRFPRSRLYGVYTTLIALSFSAGLGYDYFRLFGPKLLAISMPRYSNWAFRPGTVSLSTLLENAYGFDELTQYKVTSLAAGIILGIFIVFAGWLLARALAGNNWKSGSAPIVLILAMIVLSGLVTLIRTDIFQEESEPECQDDLIRRYEAVGAHLAELIPPGSQVYWIGSLSVAPLLEVPHITIYPSQINDGYAYRLGGDPEELLRFGLWNDALASQWRGETDYIVVEEQRFTEERSRILESHAFDELAPSGPTNPCRPGTELHIFRRVGALRDDF